MDGQANALGNTSFGMAHSYYVATANPFPPAPALAGTAEADVCVIGGGCTGLSAALSAARRGFSVILLEGGHIGWGASGRNGGQIIPGLRKGPAELVGLYGRDFARRLFDLGVSARDLVVGLVRDHDIACDLSLTGHLHAAVRQHHLRALDADAECCATVMNYPHITMLSRAEMQEEVQSTDYCGGLLDRQGGHLHPLNYATGLARAAAAAGVRLFERSRVTALDDGRTLSVTTAHGSVRARFGVLACDALLGRLAPPIAGRMMPIASHIVATAPLPPGTRLIANRRAVCDGRFAVNYYRMTADNRLLFGGGERYLPGETADIAALVRRRMIKVFPQLAGQPIDHAWGGLVAITTTRMPDVGRLGNLFYAHGYSGQGAIISTLAGQVLAEAMAGTAERFDLLARVAPPAFPGGTRLRTPLHVLGMLWYALRDWL